MPTDPRTVPLRLDRDLLAIVRQLEIEADLDPTAVPDPGAGLDQTEYLAHVSA